jgi:phenylpropionate dioxygenase-like ring-hydroxylating dioxygenase large terminal subunit
MPDMTSPATDNAMPADWATALVSPEAFAREQAVLAHVWTFLGLADDLARDGDWIRASIGTRSVFVQRFGADLKGFENVCAHRFYPLRTADRGNGPIVCGFHHWRYDKDGQALGIPVCEQVFGVVSRALDARLDPIEVATCGALVFGRFPAAHATQSLEDFLGDAFPILAALARWPSTPRRWSLPINANWRLSLHISLDDYHIAAIHPHTLGRQIDTNTSSAQTSPTRGSACTTPISATAPTMRSRNTWSAAATVPCKARTTRSSRSCRT